MALALAEAMKGLGRTHPNPSVGAVLVKRNTVVGAGFTSPPGGLHAERHAIAAAGKKARGATLYCTLEPCNHTGRTGPCTEAIIAAGISRVVFAGVDSNPHVPGHGRERLEAAGIEVVGGVMADEIDQLNAPFFKAMKTGRAWVTAKAGVTLDGKLATSSGRSKWITSEESRALAHQLRDRVDAILVGAGTVAADDPSLTTRLSEGAGRTPVRLVLDPSLRTRPGAKVYDTTHGRSIIVTTAKAARKFAARGVEVWSLPSKKKKRAIDLEQLVMRLCSEGLLHLLVEGGATTHAGFFEAGLVDEVVLFVAPKLFGGDGVSWVAAMGIDDPASAVGLFAMTASGVGDDVVLSARVKT